MSRENPNKELYEFGPFRVDVAERVLTKRQQAIPLTPKAFDTLVVLLRNSGHVVEKDELLKEVWPDTFVEEGVLAVNIAALRKALNEGGDGRSYIETVPRRGYRFIAEVQALGRSSGDEAAAQKTERKKSPTRPLWFAAALLALVLAGFGWFFSRPRPTSIPPPSPPIPLTSYAGTELSPTFSPDGSQVAFSWDGKCQDNFDIYVKVIGGADAVRLTRDPARDMSPAWSPDGRHIAFAREGAVFLIEPTGSGERKVADVQARDIAWTRAGKSLVVSSSSGNRKYRLILLSVDTRKMKDLTRPLGEGTDYGDVAPVVSPDGLKLVFVRYMATVGADIYLMPLVGGDPRRLTQDESQTCGGVTWTADGRDVVYSSRGSLWRRSVEAQPESLSKRVEGIDPAGALQPAISRPDSALLSRLAYSRVVFDTNIWVRETTASSLTARTLVASTRPDTNPQFSPDGRRLVFTSERSGSPQIWVANRDGSNPLQLTSFAESFINAPRWSPDGKTIVFTSAQNKNQDIYSVSADGGGSPQRLTTVSSREGRASWSRDGHWVYFYSTRTGRDEIWKMPAKGGEAEAIQLTTGGGHESFESPDGKLLYYEDYGVKGLRRISIESYSGPREGSSVIPTVQPGLWAVTEQGIYFIEFDDRGAASRDAVRLLRDDRVPKVSHRIKFYDFRTHQFTQIGTIEKDIVRGDSGFCATWDGSTIAWSQIDQRESDLMMIENFR